jgi:hypothetical protein
MGAGTKKVDKATEGKPFSEVVTDNEQRVRHCEYREPAEGKLK